VRIRILDGTGRLANGLGAVSVFVSAGAEVATLGNATTFSYGVTQFIVAADGNLAEAEALRDALGVGEIVTSSEQASAVDVTVVLGSDAVPLIGGS
jgi:calcineurin-like phosphoesterase